MNERTKNVKPSDEVIGIPKSALVALAKVLAPFVAQHLSSPSSGDVYTSRDGERPPHISRRAFAERCRTIATAAKSGHTWSVPRADWFAATRTKQAIAPAAPESAVQVAPVANDVDALLEAAGLRASRRAG